MVVGFRSEKGDKKAEPFARDDKTQMRRQRRKEKRTMESGKWGVYVQRSIMEMQRKYVINMETPLNPLSYEMQSGL